jgi:chromate transport protein ChrA
VTIAALTWPQASVYIALILACGFVVAVLIWSIFRTGQMAIHSESRARERRGIDGARSDSVA